MTNKVLAIIFAVFAVLLYTMAVIDFTQGHVADGIGNLLFAASDTLMAYAMLRIERQREALGFGKDNGCQGVYEYLKTGVFPERGRK